MDFAPATPYDTWVMEAWVRQAGGRAGAYYRLPGNAGARGCKEPKVTQYPTIHRPGSTFAVVLRHRWCGG